MSNKYGTWSTWDLPTENQEQAIEWAQAEVEKLGGRAWVKYNPHEFGEYPSLEINQPVKLVDVDVEDEDEDLIAERDNWVDAINELEAKFCEKWQS